MLSLQIPSWFKFNLWSKYWLLMLTMLPHSCNPSELRVEFLALMLSWFSINVRPTQICYFWMCMITISLFRWLALRVYVSLIDMQWNWLLIHNYRNEYSHLQDKESESDCILIFLLLRSSFLPTSFLLEFDTLTHLTGQTSCFCAILKY